MVPCAFGFCRFYCKTSLFNCKIGLPWWSSGWELACHLMGCGSIRSLGRFHMPWGNRTCDLQLLNSHASNTEADPRACAKSLQSCPTLCDHIDGSPPGSPVPGILQARTREWVAISFSNAWKWKVKVKSLSRFWLSWPHGLQPTRRLRPWDFPGKSTGVGCHCLLPQKREDRMKTTINHNHRKLIKLITWTTVLSNSTKLWAMPCRATQHGQILLESSEKM